MRLFSYLQLMRLDKPIGVWLVFFPAAWAVLLSPQPLDLRLLVLMLFGAFLIRAAGCIINDLADAKLDRQVARTRRRPLASGAVTPRGAWILLTLLLLLGLLLCLILPAQVLVLSLIALPLIAAYPWMKRITFWPQAFLGLTFNFGALIGWASTGAPLMPTAFLLYAACIFWTLGYDTLYAVQDMADDARIGIKSSARRIGTGPSLPLFIVVCYGMMLILLGLALSAASFDGMAAWLALLATAAHAAWQVNMARHLEPSDPRGGMLFRSNQWLGLILLGGLLLQRLL